MTIEINDPSIQPPQISYPGEGQTHVKPEEPDVPKGDLPAFPETTVKEDKAAEKQEQDLFELAGSINSGALMARSRQAFDASEDFFNNNIRPKLNDSIRAFNSQHAAGSHFSSTNKAYTSKLYRPKTRAVIDKRSAACNIAFFSNPEIAHISAENASNPQDILAAHAMKALIQYRCEKTLPWMELVLGGFQDTDVQGLCCFHYYWKLEHDSQGNVTVDEPAVDLIPLEHIRWDPSADPMDIVNSSPYLIRLHYMYVQDVKEEIAAGFFKSVEVGAFDAAASEYDTNTNLQRNQTQQDPDAQESKGNTDYKLVCVQEHIHRIKGQEYVWFTLGRNTLLRDPEPLEDLYFHGKRPYVIGKCRIETHRTFTSSTAAIVSPLQEEMNEIVNQRLNNVKLALNKKYLIKSDSIVDLGSLLRNQPGSATYTEDPEKDVRELTTPDVTQSSYAEQNFLNQDFADVIGDFSTAQVPNTKGAETVRGMQMLNNAANSLIEHSLRIYATTAVVPLLEGLVALEQHYETNEVLLALVSSNPAMQQALGGQPLQNKHLRTNLTIDVNVGMNVTDPQMRQARLVNALSTYAELAASPAAASFNMQAIAQEIFANAGYGNGERFLNPQVDPRIATMQKETILMRAKVADKSQTAQQNNQTKLQIAREKNATTMAIAEQKTKSQNAQVLVKHAKDLTMEAMANQQPTPGQL